MLSEVCILRTAVLLWLYGVAFFVDQIIFFFNPSHALFVTVINVTIFPEFSQVEEADTTIMFNISRDDDLTLDRNVIVRVSAEDGTVAGKQKNSELFYVIFILKTQENDFNADDLVLTFTEPGASSFLYTVDILQDAIAEGSEQLFVRLSASPNETGVSFHRNTAEISIIDNDGNL